jgi:hypothetical protein
MKLAVLALVCTLAGVAHADGDDFGGGTVIFARGAALYRVDPKGKGETEIATLAAAGSKVAVRALRTDAEGKTLLVDVAGKWSWLPLDGSTKTLAELPCADGPAQLAEDGQDVLCRAKTGGGSIIVSLKDGKTRPLEVPPVGSRLVGTAADRRVVWIDKTGVWSAPARDLKQKQQVAEPPLRSFLASPDGQRGVGIYLDKVYTSVKDTKPAEVLMGFALDGKNARRKAIKNGVPIEWSHDDQWVLVQDGGSACIMMANGGNYKCWRGYTGASVASDGRWGLVLGNRDGSKKQTPPPKKPAKAPPKAPPKDTEPTDEPESADGEAATDDVEVPPPTGPLALYRTRLEGAFTDAPALIVKVVDGAAVWIPGPIRPNL